MTMSEAQTTSTQSAVSVSQRIAFDSLIEPARVHGSVYTRQDIFDAEMKRIFGAGWVFLAHESEIPEPGDYVTRNIGGQPLVMSRGRDGVIRCFYNRCTHRGNMLCRSESGTGQYIQCPYHGWKFASDGALMGVPKRAGYGTRFKELGDDLSLAAIARLDSYRGFVFGMLSDDGSELADHLGHAAGSIDRLLDLSPSGGLDLSVGWVRHRVLANWKSIFENQVDGYHALYVHQSVYDAISPARVDYGTKELRLAVRDLGGGHSEIDYRDEYRRLDREFGWFGNIARSKVPRYIEDMEATNGDGARQILVDGPPHTVLYPNLFLAELNIMMFEPIGPAETIVHTIPTLLADAPEMNERIRRRAEGAMGPAGFLIADDADMAERNQIGLAAGHPEWIELSRGLETDVVDETGPVNGDESAETSQRAFWSQYRSAMMAGS